MRKYLLSVLSLFLALYTLAGHVAAMSLDSPNLEPLAQRVMQAIAAQQAAVAQFQADRQAILTLADSQGSDMKPAYRSLFHAHNDSVQAVVAVSSSIAEVDQTATEIFREWEQEIAVYTDARLKSDSQAEFAKTQQNYEGLMVNFRQAESKLDPALASLKGNVTHFKYQLDADALASRKPEMLALEQDIADVIDKLNTSIRSAEAFVKSIQP